VLLLGFAKQEREFWQRVLADVEVTDDITEATLCVVNDLMPDCAATSDFKKLRTLCVVGAGKVIAAWHSRIVGTFPDVRDYALLPSHNPRLIIPLGRCDWIVQGLALHRPGRWIAKMAVALIKGFARVGVVRPLRARMVCIANKSVGMLSQGARQAGLELSSNDAPQSFALYLGTPNDNRKTVILPLGGMTRSILKYGELRKAKAALKNETMALQAMSQTSLATHVPVLFDWIERDASVTLHQEYRPRRRFSASKMRQAAVKFLIELSKQGRHIRPLAAVLADSGLMTVDEAREAGRSSFAAVRQRLDSFAISGATIWGHRTHGDFAPWNCTWTDKGFFVFDWEDSVEWDLAFGDAFYFAVSPAVHIAHLPSPAKVEARAIALAEEVAHGADLPTNKLYMNWALWLLLRSTRKPAPLYERLLLGLQVSWKKNIG